VYVDLLAVGLSPALPALGTQATVRTEKASYSPGEPITVHFTNADGLSDLDWRGSFAAGDSHTNYLDFIYLRHATDGSVTFVDGLPGGVYDVRLFWDDTYDFEAGNVFIVE
jgi:hypothetical protein